MADMDTKAIHLADNKNMSRFTVFGSSRKLINDNNNRQLVALNNTAVTGYTAAGQRLAAS